MNINRFGVNDMIFGIGIDEIEVGRVIDRMAATSGLREQLFTSAEIAYCESQKHGGRSYAARYAAKEAFLKALGTGWRDGLAYLDIEIVHDFLGKPALILHGRAKQYAEERRISGMHLSLTHLDEIAGAIVVLEN